ncbi:MAG: MFS transporter [Alphaproteobacteria bacterium]
MNKNTLFHKDFTLVILGQIISLFGNQILRYALPLYLLNKTGSAALFGTIMAVSLIPMLLFFPIGGLIADRMNKKNIMVALDFCMAILIFIFCLLIEQISIVSLIAITMIILYAIQGAYQPAVQASIPSLVDNSHMMKANSIVNLTSSAANMVGPILGGILFSIMGLMPILYISAACFLLSALMEIFIHIPHKKKQYRQNIIALGFSDIKESFHFIFKKQPFLWKTSLIFASINLFLTSLILISLPVLITQFLGFSPDIANRLYGYGQGIIGAGAIIGGLFAAIFAQRLKLSLSPWFLIGCTLSILIIGIALQTLKSPMEIYIILVLACALLITLSTLFQIQIITCLQILTPKHLIGKVISCFICICMCTSPLGQFVYGIIFDKIGTFVFIPFYIAGLLMIIISLCTYHFFYKAQRLIKSI